MAPSSHRKPPVKRVFLRALVVGSLLMSVVVAAGAAHGSGSLRYVALGSSFAAGPGVPDLKPGVPGACGRSTRNYPTLAAVAKGATLVDVTCGGATTANVLSKEQAGLPPQIQAVTADADVVTVTIGGNDVNYMGSLMAYGCQNSKAAKGRTKACPTVDRAAMLRGLDTLHERIGAVYAEIHRRAPDALVFALIYQAVLPAEGPSCAGLPLTDDQLAFERTVVARLEAATRRAARAHDVTVIDTTPITRDHGVCSAEPWMEPYVPPPGRVGYHPNEAGMAAVAELVAAYSWEQPRP